MKKQIGFIISVFVFVGFFVFSPIAILSNVFDVLTIWIFDSLENALIYSEKLMGMNE